MKAIIIILIGVIIGGNLSAQLKVQFINDVPESFKQNYNRSVHEYNPLHVGDMWQYYFHEGSPLDPTGYYYTTKILKDSIINNKLYYKKNDWRGSIPTNFPYDYTSWERNDSLTGISYMLDYIDVDADGDTLDELLIDSLELPNDSSYISYKYSYKIPPYSDPYPGPKTAILEDSGWAVIEGDTVMFRKVLYSELFLYEYIFDKFGIWMFVRESPTRYVTGAIINGKTYGTIVQVDDNDVQIPDKIILYDNYPNPFNPVTKIRYLLPDAERVSLIVYDILGRKIRTLADEYKTSGYHEVDFIGNDLSSGVYFYTLLTNTRRITKKMILLK